MTPESVTQVLGYSLASSRPTTYHMHAIQCAITKIHNISFRYDIMLASTELGKSSSRLYKIFLSFAMRINLIIRKIFTIRIKGAAEETPEPTSSS